MAEARGRLEGARLALENGFRSQAVSSAYYAMLYAVRAALSEEDRYAKSHRGTWQLFRKGFVLGGRFDPELVSAARTPFALTSQKNQTMKPISPIPMRSTTTLSHVMPGLLGARGAATA